MHYNLDYNKEVLHKVFTSLAATIYQGFSTICPLIKALSNTFTPINSLVLAGFIHLMNEGFHN